MAGVRLLPLLAIAAVCLFALKSAGMLFGGGYMLSGSAPASAQATQAEDQEPPAAEEEQTEPEQAAAEPDAAEAQEAAAPESKGGAEQDVAAAVGPSEPIGSEKAVLSRLSERRKVLDARDRELNLRENLLKAAEQRVEARIKELKAIEQRIETELKKRDSTREAEYAKLVTLYAKMKPKRAARIFNRLDIEVLTGLVRKMKPRTVSPIFAAMDPAVAERVTMRIAETGNSKVPGSEALPKISGGNPG